MDRKGQPVLSPGSLGWHRPREKPLWTGRPAHSRSSVPPLWAEPPPEDGTMVRSDKHPLPVLLHLPRDSTPSGSGGHAAWGSCSTRRGLTDTSSAGTVSLGGALQGACNVAPIGIFIFMRPHPRHVPHGRRQLSGPVAPQVWLPGGARWCGAVRKGQPGPGPDCARRGGVLATPPPSPSAKTRPIVRLLGLIPQRVLGPRQEEGITHLPLNLVSWCRVHTQKQEAGATGSDCRTAHLEHLGAGLCPHWDMGP